MPVVRIVVLVRDLVLLGFKSVSDFIKGKENDIAMGIKWVKDNIVFNQFVLDAFAVSVVLEDSEQLETFLQQNNVQYSKTEVPQAA